MSAEVEASRVAFDVVVDGRTDLAAAVTAALVDGGGGDVLVLLFREATEQTPIHYTFVVDWQVSVLVPFWGEGSLSYWDRRGFQDVCKRSVKLTEKPRSILFCI